MNWGKGSCAAYAEGGHQAERRYEIEGEGAGGNEHRDIRFTASPRADAHGTQPDQPADRRTDIDDPERRLPKTMREVGLDESDSCRIVTSDRDRAPGADAGQRVVRGGGYPKDRKRYPCHSFFTNGAGGHKVEGGQLRPRDFSIRSSIAQIVSHHLTLISSSSSASRSGCGAAARSALSSAIFCASRFYLSLIHFSPPPPRV